MDRSDATLSPRRFTAALLPAALGLLTFGCHSAPPDYEGAFSASQQLKGTTTSIAAPMDTTWSAALEVLSQQGFLIQQADTNSRIILANRELQDDQDKDLSYTIAATLTLASAADHSTHVMVAANETTEMHKSEHTWWHLLWIIPLVPTGTEYTTVVVGRDTVRSPQFYSDFFDAVRSRCESGKSAPLTAGS